MDAIRSLLCRVEPAIPDAALLDRFLHAREESAFAELVRRHGPVVYRICRHLVGSASADDAFQATFLVLATKTSAARASGGLGGWLVNVAGRVGRQMRRAEARRARYERATSDRAHEDGATGSVERGDQFRVLDEELTRLPDALRDPVVLCLLQGYTQEQAAVELGRDARTVRRRLERAKALLRERLEWRGVIPMVAGAMVAGIGDARAAVPPELRSCTVELVFDFLTGGTAPVALPPVTLAKGLAMKTFARKLAFGATVMAVGLVSFGALAGGDRPEAPVPAMVSARVKAAPVPPPAPEDESKAIAFVEKVGGTVTRNEKAPGKPVTGVSLEKTLITDASLKELAPFRHLNTLDLCDTRVTDAGLKELARFKNLTTLELVFTDVTDAGMKELAALEKLNALELGGTEVTDVGLKDVGRLKGLVYLGLGTTKVTDAGMKELTALKNLTGLCLGSTRIGDAGLKELATLQSLTRLYLENTAVTDAGLKDVRALRELTNLGLYQTKVTDAGKNELRKALPKCRISP